MRSLLCRAGRARQDVVLVGPSPGIDCADAATLRAVRIAGIDTACPTVEIADCRIAAGADPLDSAFRLLKPDEAAADDHDGDPLSPDFGDGPALQMQSAWTRSSLGAEAQSQLRDHLVAGDLDAAQAALFDCSAPAGALAERLNSVDVDGELFSRRGIEAFSACPEDAGPAACRWYAADGDRGRDRRQAAATIPLLAGLIAGDPHLRSLVDRRRSLNEGLRQVFPHLGKGGLRRLGRIHASNVDQRAMGEAFLHTTDADAINAVRDRRLPLAGHWRIAEAVRWLDGAVRDSGGIDVIPSSEEEWNAFATIWSGMIMPTATHFGCSMSELRPAGGKWTQLLQGLQTDLGLSELPDRRTLNVAVVDAATLADRLTVDILLPVMLTQGRAVQDSTARQQHCTSQLMGRTPAFRMLVGGRPKQVLRALAATARRGLTRLAALDQARQQASAISREDGGNAGRRESEYMQASRWESPWNDWRAPDGTMVSWLTSRQAMEDEGDAMGHCIGRMPGYRLACRRGKAIACAVRAPGGEAATAFLKKLDGGRASPIISEMHGRCNQATPERCRRAVTDFISEVAAGRIQRLAGRDAYLEWLGTAEARQAVDVADIAGGEGPAPWEQFCGRRIAGVPGEETTRQLWQVWCSILPGASRAPLAEQAVFRQPDAQAMYREIAPHGATPGLAPAAAGMEP